MSGSPFRRVAIVGYGLIGSSLGRALRAHKLADEIVAIDRSAEAVEAIRTHALADQATSSIADGIPGADLVVLATPVATTRAVGAAMAPYLEADCIVTDVGSVKAAVMRDLAASLPPRTIVVPGHPIAGTEHSGPLAGFAELFQGRWTLLTPSEATPREAVDRVAGMWRGVGAEIAEMDAEHHDLVLAITSHLPHLIAYTIVGTAVDLEDSLKSEVVKYSASGFRDFTRIAASDPTMWRDVFLNNREAVLEMLQRFSEDLTRLQRAIRHGDGETLFDHFARGRAIRRGVIEAKQA